MKKQLVPIVLLASCIGSAAFAQTWLPAASIPGQGRHHPVTFVLNGLGYLATGTTSGAAFTKDFFRYDPSSDTWEVLPNFPGAARSYSYGGSFNGKGYLGFGSAPAYLADLWEYDPTIPAWTPLAPLPGAGRTHPAFIITDDGKIFVGCGGGAGGNLKDWWEYDIASNVWTRRTDFPGPARHHPFYFNIGNTPYIMGGHGTSVFKDVYRWNRDDNTWTHLTDFPSGVRNAGTQFTWENTGYVLSGLGAGEIFLPAGEFWKYDPTADHWTQLVSHPGGGRWAPGSFLIGDALYMMAGETSIRMERDMWTCDLNQTVGLPGPTSANRVSFVPYPNPIRGRELRLLGLESTPGIEVVRLLSADGREVSRLGDPSTTLSIPPGLASGQYFISLSTKDGKSEARSITVVR